MVAALLGTPLMPHQQYVADVVLEIDPDTGRLVYDEWILVLPRQQGKSTLILAKATHRCTASTFFGSRQQVVYTAQSHQKARKKWREDYCSKLQESAKFASRVKPNFTSGDEHLRFVNQSRFGVESNTERAGHGDVLDEAYIDEAFAQVDSRLELAFEPAMMTRANSQLAIVSTVGWADSSPYLWAKVQAGRALVAEGATSGTAFFEWSADPAADPGVVETWLSCMPAVHRPDCDRDCRDHTVALATIQAAWDKARREGKISEFCRSYLNQWKPKPKAGDETALGNWNWCRVDPPDEPPIPDAFGVALSLDRTMVSIGAALIDDDGRLVVGAQGRWAYGFDELVTELARLQSTYGLPIVMDTKGPGGDLIPDLELQGIQIVAAGLEQFIDGCALIEDGVRLGTLVHHGHPDLDEAAEGARWRPVGDRKVLGRRQSVTDLSMLEAVALAAHGASANDSLKGVGIW